MKDDETKLMANDKCGTCRREVTTLGCRVSEKPLRWCPMCGTLYLCSGEVIVPHVAQVVYVDDSDEATQVE